MKKFLIFIFLLSLFCSVSLADTYDFRNVTWGMSREEVKPLSCSPLKGRVTDAVEAYRE
jgi:hypothetical protein